MQEYTNLVLIFLILTYLLDNYWLKTKVTQNKRYYLFLVFVIILQTIVDNYLNGRWGMGSYIVGPYDPEVYSRIKIWYTPLENYFYGIALVTMNISVFEWFKKRKINKR